MRKLDKLIKITNKKEKIQLAKFETKYYIDGQDLKSFCKNHDYNYSSARNMISSDRKKHPNWTTEDILRDVKKRLEKGRTKYFFGDSTLNIYCKKNGIVSSTVRRKYNRMKANPKYRELTDDKIMQKALEESKMGHNKYRVDGILLSVYCRLNEINRGTIINKINR